MLSRRVRCCSAVMVCLATWLSAMQHAYASPIEYRYDALSRLVRTMYSDGLVVSYVYDKAGNRLSEVVDTAAPSVAIEVPTATGVYSTSAATLDLSGTAADDVAVAEVTWSNDRGGSGTTVGTTNNWTVLGILLQPGVNVLTVTATDTVGKTAVGTLTVTLAVSTPTHTPTQNTTPIPTGSNTPTASATPTQTPTRTPTFTAGTSTATATSTPTPTKSATITATPSLACVGDCNGNGSVTVDEVLTLVNIALGNTPVTSCRAGDANHDNEITVDEILAAVNHALNGCGG